MQLLDGKKVSAELKNKIKVEVAVARGKKKFDKREDSKKRTVERENRREISDR